MLVDEQSNAQLITYSMGNLPLIRCITVVQPKLLRLTFVKDSELLAILSFWRNLGRGQHRMSCPEKSQYNINYGIVNSTLRSIHQPATVGLEYDIFGTVIDYDWRCFRLRHIHFGNFGKSLAVSDWFLVNRSTLRFAPV